MKTYREQEEDLFRRWIERARELHEEDVIARDGILYRGEIEWNGIAQVHRPGSGEQIWREAEIRLLVLTKELDEEDGWDLRGETGRVPSPRLTCRTAQRFFPNLELWVYGLMNIAERKVPTFAAADNATRLQGFYENAAIARVNCRKQPAAKAASNTVLARSMENYADLLTEQIKMYGPDVILCVGGQGLMVDFLGRHVYEDLQQVNVHCWYSAAAKVAVVKQYHPCYNVYSRKEMYTEMVKDYGAFLKATPEFPAGR